MKSLLTTLFITVAMAASAFGADLSTLEQAFEQAQTYVFGQSRQSLATIEDWIRHNLDNEAERAEVAIRLAGLLGSETTLECKDFACRQLALIGTKDQIPALAPLLTEPQTSDMARYALER
ncbi:MAG TPA: hypothetical protein PKH07_08455, partial [bacterium]|nr:hypothetical protein [bacterium]